MQLSALAHYMGHNSHKTRALLEIDLTPANLWPMNHFIILLILELF